MLRCGTEARMIRDNGPDLQRSTHTLQRFSGPIYFKMTEKDRKKIDYQFVPVPTSLLFALDPDCLMAIALMIDKESYWMSRNKVFNGYFTLSVQELAEYLRFQNKQDARLTLEALYRAGLIDVKAESGKRLGAKIKLNWDKIKSEDIDYVEKLPRGTKITYCPDTESTIRGTTGDTDCTPTLEIDQTKNRLEEDIDKEIDTEEEPSAMETSSISFEDYLQLFIDSHPYINYSFSPEAFNNAYSQELTDFHTTICNETGLVFPTDVLAFYIKYYQSTGKVYDFSA